MPPAPRNSLRRFEVRACAPWCRTCSQRTRRPVAHTSAAGAPPSVAACTSSGSRAASRCAASARRRLKSLSSSRADASASAHIACSRRRQHATGSNVAPMPLLSPPRLSSPPPLRSSSAVEARSASEAAGVAGSLVMSSGAVAHSTPSQPESGGDPPTRSEVGCACACACTVCACTAAGTDSAASSGAHAPVSRRAWLMVASAHAASRLSSASCGRPSHALRSSGCARPRAHASSSSADALSGAVTPPMSGAAASKAEG
eukprot:2621438-Prymnesium_polylepis.1